MNNNNSEEPEKATPSDTTQSEAIRVDQKNLFAEASSDAAVANDPRDVMVRY